MRSSSRRNSVRRSSCMPSRSIRRRFWRAWRPTATMLPGSRRRAAGRPTRIKLPAGQSLLALCRQVQDSQSRLMAHQHLGLSEIQGLTGLGELFDTLFVFENYPLEREALAAEAGGLRLTDTGGVDATH